MPQKVLAVVSVLGKDQKGVVAQFATYMATRGINIEDIEQRVVRGIFVMDMLVDLADLSTDLTSLITGLIELGKSIDMDVRVHLHGERKPKKLALLVSKEPHCLQQLLHDIHERKLHGQAVTVLANHPDLEPLAHDAGLPFAWQSSDDPAAHFKWLGQSLKHAQPDLIVLARYMRSCRRKSSPLFRAGSSTFIPRCCHIFPVLRPTSRRTNPACACTGARPIL